MIVRTLVKKGTDHPVYCEDDLFTFEKDELFIGAIFDGCSTGIKSHFASALHAKILKNVVLSITNSKSASGFLQYATLSVFIRELKKAIEYLQLDTLEVLSTMIICFIQDNKVDVYIIGDGCVKIDDRHFKYESEGNAPDYPAYHVNDSILLGDYVKELHTTFVKDVSICSDGIYSFKGPDLTTDYFSVVDEKLLQDVSLINSEAMLGRKYNMLTKQGLSNYDDISIVRFIK